MRKSCLKRPSFEVPEPKLGSHRSSKFDLMDIKQVDGRVLNHHHKNEGNNVENSDSDN